ncbi:MAG TPA: hypothetical protein VNL13_00125 [Sulfolobales archaeon]|nr:hypothetical protein [Sulfolobales archaeon]
MLGGARDSKVSVGGVLVNFVDREVEIERIVGSGVTGEIVGYGAVALLYGPKGCGKSTLFSILTRVSAKLSEAGDAGFRPIYVGYDEHREVVDIVSSKDVIEAIRGVYGGMGFEIGVSTSVAGVHHSQYL